MFSLCVRVLSGSPAFALRAAVMHSGAQTAASAGDAVREKESVLASCTTSSRWHRVVRAFVSIFSLPLYERRAVSNCE